MSFMTWLSSDRIVEPMAGERLWRQITTHTSDRSTFRTSQMVKVPAFCENCGAIFPSDYELRGEVNLSGNLQGCPVCGHFAHLPDGVFRFTEDTITLLTGPDRTVEELKILKGLLERLQEEKPDRETVVEALKRDAPQLSKLTDLLPQSRSELYGFLAVVLAAIGIVLGQNCQPADVSINVEQVITQVCEQPKAAGTTPSDSLEQGEPEIDDNKPPR